MTSTETEAHTVTIDYRQTLDQMIAAGAYDHVNRHITESSFPVAGGNAAERELTLVFLGRVASTDEVLLSQASQQPAGPDQLDAFRPRTLDQLLRERLIDRSPASSTAGGTSGVVTSDITAPLRRHHGRQVRQLDLHRSSDSPSKASALGV